MYQDQVAAWFQQNQAHQMNNNNQGQQDQPNGQNHMLMNQGQAAAQPEQPHHANGDEGEVQNAMLIDPPLVDFHAIFADQGVPMFAGIPPPATNTTDSPMQAWTDSISSP